MKHIPYSVAKAVDAYLITKAFAKTKREQCERIERAILEREVWEANPAFVERGRPSRITEPSQTYLMKQDLWSLYYGDVRDGWVALGETIESEPGAAYHDYKCPALIAENAHNDMRLNLLCEIAVMLGKPREEGKEYHCSHLRDDVDRMIDLTVRQVVGSPGYRNPLTNEKVA